LWVVSYLLLWVLVVVLSAVVVGALHQIGLLRTSLVPRGEPAGTGPPTAEGQGPAIGSLLPRLELESINGAGHVTLDAEGPPTLVAFLSPLCDGCQDAVAALDALAVEAGSQVRVVAILIGEQRAWRSFLRVFPLSAPVVGDRSRDLSNAFKVDAVPFGLLYDERGRLVRKAILRDATLKLAFLLGESAPIGDTDVFPIPQAPAGATLLGT
jgi:methylamine dehydrogenase accessory protein MauD